MTAPEYSLDFLRVLLDTRPLFGHLCKGNVQCLYGFTVNEHWHLELMADIMELVMSASFSLVF